MSYLYHGKYIAHAMELFLTLRKYIHQGYSSPLLLEAQNPSREWPMLGIENAGKLLHITVL